MSPINSASISASAPGKTNLFFAVGPLQSDGYHEVASVYLALDLREEVTVTASEEWSVTVTGNIAQSQIEAVPTGAENLVVQAAMKVAEMAGLPADSNHVAFEVDKHVPVAGGMGGGSADAAAALMAVDALWQTNLGSRLADSVRLGADVPFALAGGVAIGVGRGEELTPITDVRPLHLVLVTSDEGLSTPAVYRRLDEIRAARGQNPTSVPVAQVPQQVIEALQSGDLDALSKTFKNDLQEAALDLRPDLAETINAGLAAGALAGFVSGSGPTIAFLSADAHAAEDLAQKLTAQGRRALATSGPAAGAFIRNEN